MDGGRWQFDCDGWTETWHRGPGGGFDRVEVGGRAYSVAQDDLTALRPRCGAGCAVCLRALPHAFSHCPACGCVLADCPAPAEPCQNVPNAGRPIAGVAALSLAGPPGLRERVALPQEGRTFAFAVAGDPARLFALDRDGGWLHEFDRRRAGWTRIAGLGEISLPDRGWGMAAGRDGLAIASADRLTVVDLARGPVPQPVATPLGQDVCVGAPCALGSELLALVARGGALLLARRPMARGGDWAFEAVRDAAPAPGTADAFSAPMVTETRASWAGRDGTVVLEAGVPEAGHRTAGQPVWRGWSEGFAPFLEHRPYVDPDGRVWQLGTMPIGVNRRGLGFERVRLHSQIDRERIGGTVLAAGILACRQLILRHRAWVERSPYDRHLPGGEGDFLVPVLAFDRQRCILIVAEDGVGELANAGPDGAGTPVPSGLRFYDGRTLHDLGLPVTLRRLSQVSAFVFAQSLYIYDAQENECWRWPLQLAG